MQAWMVSKRGKPAMVRLEMQPGELAEAADRLSDAQKLLEAVDRFGEHLKAELLGKWFSAKANEVPFTFKGTVPEALLRQGCAGILAWGWGKGKRRFKPAERDKQAAADRAQDELSDRVCELDGCENRIPKKFRGKGCCPEHRKEIILAKARAYQHRRYFEKKAGTAPAPAQAAE